ncbi:TetR/AcrR family transcriptional regulator [Prauserella oleivorans]
MNQPEAGSPATTRRRPDRKSQLARIAADLFCERGYHAVGLGDIATGAGITGPAIYRHFRNKQAVLAAAAHDLAAAIDTAVAGVPATGAPWERLDAMTRALTKLVIERRRSAQLYQWERRYLEPEDHATFTATISSLVRTVADLLGRAGHGCPRRTAPRWPPPHSAPSRACRPTARPCPTGWPRRACAGSRWECSRPACRPGSRPSGPPDGPSPPPSASSCPGGNGWSSPPCGRSANAGSTR